MGRSLSKVMIIGNVGSAPEIRMTPSGSKAAKVSVATNRTYQDRAGQTQEKTDWHRLTFFGNLADIVEQWVHKGDRLFVEGRLEYSQSEGNGGTTRYWTDIIVNDMVMLGSSSSGTEGSQGGAGGSREDQDRTEAQPGPFGDPADDLPF